MYRHSYVMAAVIALGLGGVPMASAQSFLDKLEGSLKDGARSVLAKPEAASSEAGDVFLGLVGDDAGEDGRGVRVVSVRPKGPAEQAGLRSNDVITSVDRQAVAKLEDMAEALKSKKPGDKVTFQIARGGQTRAMAVILGRKSNATAKAPAGPAPAETLPLAPAASDGTPAVAPADGLLPAPAAPAAVSPAAKPASTVGPNADASPTLPPPMELRAGSQPLAVPADVDEPAVPPPPSEPDSDAAPVPPPVPAAPDVLPAPAPLATAAPAGKPSLGITVKDLSLAARTTYGLTVREGALVTAVRPGSPADQAGIPVGAAIVAIDGRRISASEDLVSAIRKTPVGQKVELTYYAGDRLRGAQVQLVTGEAGGVPAGAPDALAFPPPWAPAKPGPLGKRPVMDRVERLIEGLGGPGTLIPPAGPGEAGEATELTRVIESLRAQVEALQKRLDDQEARLQALEKARP